MASLDQPAKTGPEACLRLENDSRLLRKDPIEQRPGDQSLLQQDLAQLPAGALLIGEGTIDFRFVEHAVRPQQNAERLSRRGRPPVSPHMSFDRGHVDLITPCSLFADPDIPRSGEPRHRDRVRAAPDRVTCVRLAG